MMEGPAANRAAPLSASVFELVSRERLAPERLRRGPTNLLDGILPVV